MHASYHDDAHGKSRRNTMLFFCMPQKSAKRLQQKRSSDTAPPLVTRGGYVVVWCRTNRSIWVPPLQPFENDNFDLAITLLTLYKPNFEWYLRKLHVAPSRLRLTWSWERTVALACAQWDWDVPENPINFTNAVSLVLLLQKPTITQWVRLTYTVTHNYCWPIYLMVYHCKPYGHGFMYSYYSIATTV